MSEQLPSEEKRPDSIVGLWNDKLLLGSQIEDLLMLFVEKYQLRMDQVTIDVCYRGVMIKVTL